MFVKSVVFASSLFLAAGQATHRGPTANSQHAGVIGAASTGQSTAPQAGTPQIVPNPGARPAPLNPMAGRAFPPRTPPNAELASKEINERVDKLLKEMTLEEKVGQLAMYTGGIATGPGTGLDNYDDMVAAGQIGSLFNVIGAKEVNHYQHIAMEKSRMKIPLLFGYDTIHGQRTTFPVPLGLASSWDADMVEQVSHIAAQEAVADGVKWVFSPMVDIARDPRWGRIVESAGEDPYLGSVLARAYIRGYQGKSLADKDSVAASVKHFAAYGAAEAGRDYNTTDMSDLTLRRVYLPPYKAAVDAGAATIMSAFNALNGVPASANPYTLSRILRRDWGFQGFVVTDYGAVGELKAHGIALDDETAAGKALSAGADMDMMSNIYLKQVPILVKDGKLPPQIVDEAVRRILRVKVAMGLFEHPYADETLPPYAATPEKREIARKAASESIILLKNQGGVLPLRKDLKTVALIGPMADSQQDMLGSWAAQGNPKDVITLRAAMQQHMDGKGRLLYAQGTEINGTSDAGFAAAVKAARSADAVIVCVGENADTQTGEASSRAHLDLPGNQQALVDAVAAAGKPMVVVLFTGRPLALKDVDAKAPAIVEAWYPGIEAGNAVYHLLVGDANFSARSPVSFPRSVGQEPLYYAQLPTGRPAGDVDLSKPPSNEANTKYLSRYIDEQNSALYPFGYGLSYSTFTYSQPSISMATAHPSQLVTRFGQATEERVVIGVDVKNTSQVAGVAVPQLYMGVRGTSVEQPVRELRGYQRIELGPGESRHVEFRLGFDEMQIYGMRSSVPTLEPGDYTFYVGGDSTAPGKVVLKMEADPRPAPPPAPKAPAVLPGAAGTPQNPDKLPSLVPNGAVPVTK